MCASYCSTCFYFHSPLPLLQDAGALHNIGTAALVIQVTGTNWPRPSFTLLVTGLCRFRLDKLVMEVPYPVGVVTQLDKLSVDDGRSLDPAIKLSALC